MQDQLRHLSLEGRIVVVSGAGGGGIGTTVTAMAARAGATVIAVSRSKKTSTSTSFRWHETVWRSCPLRPTRRPTKASPR